MYIHGYNAGLLGSSSRSNPYAGRGGDPLANAWEAGRRSALINIENGTESSLVEASA